MVKVGDVVEGRYRIIKTLGEGGMGTVFLAEHALIRRRVAIKVLHPELATDADVVERFMNEARAAGTLGHPNIVESTDMGFTQDMVPYIVFEYLEGTLLTDEIYRVGGLPVRRAIRIAQQIASALHAAHNADIVHRDLKSDNVFLTDKDDALDHVKVLDFGISRFLDIDDEQTRRGMVMGTPEFMAPEQITSPQSVDRRADIYALGVILYEMVMARRPFSNEADPRALLHRIVHEPPPPLDRPEVPHALVELITHRLLAKSPNDRYQTMVDVEAALDAFVTHGDGASRRSRPIPVPDVARNSGFMPRPARMTNTPWPDRHDTTLQAVTLPAVVERKVRPRTMYAVGGAGLLVGVLGLLIGLRGGSNEASEPQVATTQTAPAPGAATPAPQTPNEGKVAVNVRSNAPNARVTFRRRSMLAPAKLQLGASDIVELVEVSAPGYKSMRYWITFDRATNLYAQLAPGNGFVEASEEETLVALGEIAPSAPTPAVAVAPTRNETPKPAAAPAANEGPSAPAAVASAPTTKSVSSVVATIAAPRKIGRAAAVQPERAVAEHDSVPVTTAEVVAEAPPPPPLPAIKEIKETAKETKESKDREVKDLKETKEAKEDKRADKSDGAKNLEAVPGRTVEVAQPTPPQPKSDAAEPAVAAPKKNGISVAQLHAVVGENRPAVLKCFAEGKKVNPKLKGTVNLQLQVDLTGRVRQVQVSSTLTGAPMVSACIVKSAYGWRFPSSSEPMSTVQYPFSIN